MKVLFSKWKWARMHVNVFFLLIILVSFWDHFGDHFGTFLASFWDHLGFFCFLFGMFLSPLSSLPALLLESFLTTFGTIFDSCWWHFLIILEYFSILYSVFRILYSVFCMMCSVFCIPYSVFCILHSLFCILYSVFCILYYVLCFFLYSVIL